MTRSIFIQIVQFAFLMVAFIMFLAVAGLELDFGAMISSTAHWPKG